LFVNSPFQTLISPFDVVFSRFFFPLSLSKRVCLLVFSIKTFYFQKHTLLQHTLFNQPTNQPSFQNKKNETKTITFLDTNQPNSHTDPHVSALREAVTSRSGGHNWTTNGPTELVTGQTEDRSERRETSEK
jgi:hypothetical protein